MNRDTQHNMKTVRIVDSEEILDSNSSTRSVTTKTIQDPIESSSSLLNENSHIPLEQCSIRRTNWVDDSDSWDDDELPRSESDIAGIPDARRTLGRRESNDMGAPEIEPHFTRQTNRPGPVNEPPCYIAGTYRNYARDFAKRGVASTSRRQRSQWAQMNRVEDAFLASNLSSSMYRSFDDYVDDESAGLRNGRVARFGGRDYRWGRELPPEYTYLREEKPYPHVPVMCGRSEDNYAPEESSPGFVRRSAPRYKENTYPSSRSIASGRGTHTQDNTDYEAFASIPKHYSHNTRDGRYAWQKSSSTRQDLQSSSHIVVNNDGSSSSDTHAARRDEHYDTTSQWTLQSPSDTFNYDERFVSSSCHPSESDADDGIRLDRKRSDLSSTLTIIPSVSYSALTYPSSRTSLTTGSSKQERREKVISLQREQRQPPVLLPVHETRFRCADDVDRLRHYVSDHPGGSLRQTLDASNTSAVDVGYTSTDTSLNADDEGNLLDWGKSRLPPGQRHTSYESRTSLGDDERIIPLGRERAHTCVPFQPITSKAPWAEYQRRSDVAEQSSKHEEENRCLDLRSSRLHDDPKTLQSQRLTSYDSRTSLGDDESIIPLGRERAHTCVPFQPITSKAPRAEYQRRCDVAEQSSKHEEENRCLDLRSSRLHDDPKTLQSQRVSSYDSRTSLGDDDSIIPLGRERAHTCVAFQPITSKAPWAKYQRGCDVAEQSSKTEDENRCLESVITPDFLPVSSSSLSYTDQKPGYHESNEDIFGLLGEFKRQHSVTPVARLTTSNCGNLDVINLSSTNVDENNLIALSRARHLSTVREISDSHNSLAGYPSDLESNNLTKYDSYPSDLEPSSLTNVDEDDFIAVRQFTNENEISDSHNSLASYPSDLEPSSLTNVDEDDFIALSRARQFTNENEISDSHNSLASYPSDLEPSSSPNVDEDHFIALSRATQCTNEHEISDSCISLASYQSPTTYDLRTYREHDRGYVDTLKPGSGSELTKPDTSSRFHQETDAPSTSSFELSRSSTNELIHPTSQNEDDMRLPFFTRTFGRSSQWFSNSNERTHERNVVEENTEIAKKPNRASSHLSESSKRIMTNVRLPFMMPRLRSNVDYFSVPKKSMSDTKEYSVMRLANGLKVLLIEDLQNHRTMAQLGNSTTVKLSIPTDGNRKRVTFKPAGEPTPPRAYLALSIAVGSFSDGDVQGLAHFVEHVIFMGSHKYPGDTAFDSSIRSHGGYDNATTDSEYTTFFFNCEQDFLSQAISQFSELFKKPLLRKKSMKEEIEVVDKEFEGHKSTELCRIQQLLGSMGKPGNLAGKFSWGSRRTLQKDISESCLHLSVRNFYRRHYSANRMGLVIQAHMSLNALEKLAYRSFSTLPNNHLPPDDLERFRNDPFDTPAFRRFYQIRPYASNNTRMLVMTWGLPSAVEHYRVKPLRYISSILSSRGTGSIIHYLESKYWVTDFHVHRNSTGFEENSVFTLFSINIMLTEEGTAHVKEITTAVFGFISVLQTAGPSAQLYQELQLLQGIRLVDRDIKRKHCSEIEIVAEDLLRFNVDDVLVGRFLYLEYDRQVIKQFLDLLVPEKVNIILDLKQEKMVYDYMEPWFKTKYNVTDIPRAWRRAWRKVHASSLVDQFSLSTCNRFLTTCFDIHNTDIIRERYPVKIYENRTLEIWYKNETRLRQPLAHYCFYFKSPISTEPVDSALMLDLLIECLRIRLLDEMQGASAAALKYEVLKEEHGFKVSVRGFDEKLPLIVGIVLENIISLRGGNIPQWEFQQVLRTKKITYEHFFMMPENLNRAIRFSLTLEPYSSSVQKHSRLNEITISKFNTFARMFFDHLRVYCLVEGNVTSKQAVVAVTTAFEKLLPGPFYPMRTPQQRVVVLKTGTRTARVHNLNSKDSTSVITHYYQSGLDTIQRMCMMRVVETLLREELTRVFIRDEDTGIQVHCMIRELSNVIGFHITAIFKCHDFSIEDVEERLTTFASKTFVQRVNAMNSQQLGRVVRDQIQQGVNTDVSLECQVYRDFEEIVNKKYLFNRIEKERSVLAKFTEHDIRRFVVDHFDATSFGTNNRRLSVQVVGNIVLEELASEPALTLGRRRGECKLIRGWKDRKPRPDIGRVPGERTTYKLELEPTTDNSVIFYFQTFRGSLALYPSLCKEEESNNYHSIDKMFNK